MLPQQPPLALALSSELRYYISFPPPCQHFFRLLLPSPHTSVFPWIHYVFWKVYVKFVQNTDKYIFIFSQIIPSSDVYLLRSFRHSQTAADPASAVTDDTKKKPSMLFRSPWCRMEFCGRKTSNDSENIGNRITNFLYLSHVILTSIQNLYAILMPDNGFLFHFSADMV